MLVFLARHFQLQEIKKVSLIQEEHYFFDIEKIVVKHKPKVVFLENVKNLVSHDNGNTFKTIISVLEDKLGYKVFTEIYIPIPAKLHKKYPNFFPEKDQDFNLQIPTGEIFSASLCQQGRKALMTNPNKALSDWLLGRVLQLKEGELATMEKLDKLGFDSVIIMKNENGNFKIDIMKTNTFIEFNIDE